MRFKNRPENTFVAFIDGIVASPDRDEETFANIHLDADREVAPVWFDYVYLSTGKVSNRGREKWLLVRTEQGWKIISVVYTMRLPKAASGS